MQISALTTFFDTDGNQLEHPEADTANGVRIPLEVLPNTSNKLPIRLPRS
jgi:hypothetical protein